MNEASARRLGIALRIALGIAVVGFIVRRIDRRAVSAAFSTIPLITLALAFACILASVMTAAYRWGVLLEAYGAKRPRYSLLLRYTFEGLFLANLPTGLAGDAARGYRVREAMGGLTKSYGVLIVERIAGLSGLMLVIAGTTLATPAPPKLERPLQVVALGGLALALLFFGVTAGAQSTLVARVPLVRTIAARIGPPARLDRLMLSFVLSVATQLTIATSIALLVHAVAPSASWSTIAQLSPYVVLLVFVPVTPAAVGQRELAFA
ncbi:MAG: lysylphosphatidylglycerol synthase transmembrane domain-containing protein, partial [Polyangiales bacterium]